MRVQFLDKNANALCKMFLCELLSKIKKKKFCTKCPRGFEKSFAFTGLPISSGGEKFRLHKVQRKLRELSETLSDPKIVDIILLKRGKIPAQICLIFAISGLPIPSGSKKFRHPRKLLYRRENCPRLCLAPNDFQRREKEDLLIQ